MYIMTAVCACVSTAVSACCVEAGFRLHPLLHTRCVGSGRVQFFGQGQASSKNDVRGKGLLKMNVNSQQAQRQVVAPTAKGSR